MIENLIKSAVENARITLLVFLITLLTGATLFNSMPREAEPDIDIPVIVVNATQMGVSTSDSENLIVKPLESKLLEVDGIKELSAFARANGADINIEFEIGINKKNAIADVRDAVSRAKADLPEGMEEPMVKEITMADQAPVLRVMLSGDLSEKLLIKQAQLLAQNIENIQSVLEVEIVGERDDQIDVLLDPMRMDVYNISLPEVMQIFRANDQLVTAGKIENGSGSYSLKIPGKIDDLYKLYTAPVKKVDNHVVELRDIATILPSLEARKSIARLNGKPAIALLIKKKAGENIVDTINKTKEIIVDYKNVAPEGITIEMIDDKSVRVFEQLYDLQNSVIFSLVLVMIVVVGFLGLRAATLVAIAIPGSFLMAFIVLSIMGTTLNMVVLFSLLLCLGLLVDGAIVVNEEADKLMSSGKSKKEAFIVSSQKMSLPIIASTITTLAAFAPLAFFPGTVGGFISYIATTALAVLSSSLVMALIVVPTLGSLIGKPRYINEKQRKHFDAIDKGDIEGIRGLEKLYSNTLTKILYFPKTTAIAIVIITFTLLKGYSSSDPVVEFFPAVESEGLTLEIKQKGDLSLEVDKDAIVREVENALIPFKNEIKHVYTEVKGNDTIGKIRLILVDWEERRKSKLISKEIRTVLSDVPGVVIEIGQDKNGPARGKDVQLSLSSMDKKALRGAAESLETLFNQRQTLNDVETSIAENGVEWLLEVNKKKITEYGVDIGLIGQTVRLLNDGVKISSYRSDFSTNEVEIRVKMPKSERNLETLNSLKIMTNQGKVPLAHFVRVIPQKKVISEMRVNGKSTLNVMANVTEGVALSEIMPDIQRDIETVYATYPNVMFEFKGQQEQQKESSEFLQKAFLLALGVMFVALVAQFKSFRQSLLILSSVFFAVVGALTYYDMMNIPFSVVMSGIGIMSLSGILINNNIILIEQFNILKSKGYDLRRSVILTGVMRLRPVLITTITSVLGLIPMSFLISVDMIQGAYTVGAPSAQWWYQLSSAIIGGLIFGALVTLIITPISLYVIYSTKSLRFFRRS